MNNKSKLQIIDWELGMYKKHTIVLSLSQELNIPLEKIPMYVYWFKLENGIDYDFIITQTNSQKYTSFELENDIKTFVTKDYFSKKRYATLLKLEDKFAVQGMKNKITKGESFIVKDTQINKPLVTTLFTIGYEGISIDGYINKLLQNNINTLVDVRKNAYSNKFGFKKKEFQHYLGKCDIKYIHIPELGIESEKRQYLNNARKAGDMPLFSLNNSKVIEGKLFVGYKNSLPQRKEHTDKLLNILHANKTIAITCFETEHTSCRFSKLFKC